MGTIVLSLDAELAWGFHDMDTPRKKKIGASRQGWCYLIELFEEFEIPATWAVVGHLMLEECDGIHRDHPAPSDWFERDPGHKATGESVWVAPELISTIQNSSVEHEIGCHTYSHVEFDGDIATEEVLRTELRLWKSLAAEHDINLSSFVFPRNRVAHQSLLASENFVCYRGNAPGKWHEKTVVSQVGKGLSMVFGRSSPPLVQPKIDEYGLVNIPASLFLFEFDIPPKQLTKYVIGDPIRRKVKLGIDKVANSDGILHLWLHPNDLVKTEDRNRIRRILEYIDRVRESKGVTVATMEEIAMQELSD